MQLEREPVLKFGHTSSLVKLSRDKGVGIEEIQEVRCQDVEFITSEYVYNNQDNGRELDGKRACMCDAKYFGVMKQFLEMFGQWE